MMRTQEQWEELAQVERRLRDLVRDLLDTIGYDATPPAVEARLEMVAELGGEYHKLLTMWTKRD